jgi:hypothetical protein
LDVAAVGGAQDAVSLVFDPVGRDKSRKDLPEVDVGLGQGGRVALPAGGGESGVDVTPGEGLHGLLVELGTPFFAVTPF